MDTISSNELTNIVLEKMSEKERRRITDLAKDLRDEMKDNHPRVQFSLENAFELLQKIGIVLAGGERR